MDTSKTFLCTVVHPRVFPGPITDPGNPLRVRLLVEIGPEDLILRASAPRAKGKEMGREPWAKIDRVAIERLAGDAQRLEILRKSLLRMALVGGIALVFLLFVSSLPLPFAVPGALGIAVFIGLLNFVLNGGLGRKQDVVRFRFTPAEGGRSFYLEVLPAEEAELHQALLAAGLKPEETEASP